MNLFTYGSLMDRRTIARVVGRTLPEAIPAVLRGYRKYETTLNYPVILPDSAAECQGLVYYSILAGDWERLDTYENANSTPPAYHRKLVTVEGKHGRISAFVYIGNLNFFRTRLIK